MVVEGAPVELVAAVVGGDTSDDGVDDATSVEELGADGEVLDELQAPSTRATEISNTVVPSRIRWPCDDVLCPTRFTLTASATQADSDAAL